MDKMDFDPECELVEESVTYGQVQLLAVHYDISGSNYLVLDCKSSIKGDFRLVFDHPQAIRVIDEGQICNFWESYHTGNGWLWRVIKGGWLELESQRSDFWLKDALPSPLLEYLVVEDQCIFVLTGVPPHFESDI